MSFHVPALGAECEIVQSLAKWKRMALKRYGFREGEGLYTDMNAIRRDEELDNLYSIYVDQWDWEQVIGEKDRTREFLCGVVEGIFRALQATAEHITGVYPVLECCLPERMPSSLRKNWRTASPICALRLGKMPRRGSTVPSL